jgi:hypothetical protein
MAKKVIEYPIPYHGQNMIGYYILSYPILSNFLLEIEPTMD